MLEGRAEFCQDATASSDHVVRGLDLLQPARGLGTLVAGVCDAAAARVLSFAEPGGHRRYSRRQLELAARMRALFDEGLTLDAAHRIARLEDELVDARRRITELETAAGDARRR